MHVTVDRQILLRRSEGYGHETILGNSGAKLQTLALMLPPLSEHISSPQSSYPGISCYFIHDPLIDTYGSQCVFLPKSIFAF